jgi:prolyl 4-hydroxylase
MSSPTGASKAGRYGVWSLVFGLAVALISYVYQVKRAEQPEVGRAPAQCRSPHYIVRTISYEPLIQHIENFLTPDEIEHVKTIS